MTCPCHLRVHCLLHDGDSCGYVASNDPDAEIHSGLDGAYNICKDVLALPDRISRGDGSRHPIWRRKNHIRMHMVGAEAASHGEVGPLSTTSNGRILRSCRG